MDSFCKYILDTQAFSTQICHMRYESYKSLLFLDEVFSQNVTNHELNPGKLCVFIFPETKTPQFPGDLDLWDNSR